MTAAGLPLSPRAARVARANAPAAGPAAPARPRAAGPTWTLSFLALLVYAISVVTQRAPLGTGTWSVALAAAGLLLIAPWRWTPLTKGLVAFLLWSGVGVLSSRYPDVSAEQWIEFAKIVIVCFIATNAIRTWRQARVFGWVFLAAYMVYPGRGAVLNYFVAGHTKAGRAVWNGIYDNPNDLAALSVLIVVVSYGIALSEPKRWLRWAALGCAAYASGVVLLTASRAGLLGLAMLVAAQGWRAVRQRRWGVIGGLALAAVVGWTVAPSTLKARLMPDGEVDAPRSRLDQMNANMAAVSSDLRKRVVLAGLDLFSSHPVQGTGIGTFYMLTGEVDEQLRGFDTHNTYVNVLVETGLVGFILYIMTIGRTLLPWGLRGRDPVPPDSPEGRWLQTLRVGMLGFLVCATFGSYSRLAMVYLFLCLYAALTEQVRDRVAAPALPGRGARRAGG
ncbi:MAG: O-antigen ligase family protein [Gemmatimonadales bacterium]|nr:O-antigen ligase family protein [Gemmatimonadales bacterium]